MFKPSPNHGAYVFGGFSFNGGSEICGSRFDIVCICIKGKQSCGAQHDHVFMGILTDMKAELFYELKSEMCCKACTMQRTMARYVLCETERVLK